MEGEQTAGETAAQGRPPTTFENGECAGDAAGATVTVTPLGPDGQPVVSAAAQEAPFGTATGLEGNTYRGVDRGANEQMSRPEPPRYSAQRPSLGRIVLFAIPDDRGFYSGRKCPAVVTRAHNDTCVNLHLLPDMDDMDLVHQTSGMHPTSVTFDDSPDSPGARTWHWPPRV